MMGWTEENLGKNIKHKKGFAFKSDWFSNKGIPVIRVSDFTEESIDSSKVVFVEDKIANEKAEYKVYYNDVIIQTVGSWPNNPKSVVGKAVKVPKELNNSLLNQNAVAIYPEQKIDSTFLYYLLKDKSFKNYIINTAQGAANQASITLESIFRYNFLCPALNVQKKIAAILLSYDHLIENNKRRITILEKIAEEIYREWFVRLRFPGYKKVKVVKSMPDAWVNKTLIDIIELKMGQSPKSEYYNEVGIGLPFHQGVGNYGDRFPLHKVYCAVEGRIAEKGDILFSVRAPVGRINIADRKLVIGRGLAAIRHKKGLNHYLYYMLRYEFSKEDIIGNGSIFNSVGKDELKKFNFMYNEEMAGMFDRMIDPLDKNIENLQSVNLNLKNTRNLLLSRLLSGKLSVEDLDIRFPKSMEENDGKIHQ